MSEQNHGANGTPSEGDVAQRTNLIDRLEIVFDRSSGAMRIGGNVCADEVALMMLYRALNLYEFRTRVAFASIAAADAAEQRRVNDILAHARAGRGV